MKKVSIISQGLSNGGAERVASIIANYLSDKGYEVQYIAVYNSKKQYQLNKNIKYTYIDVLSKNKIQKFILRSKKIAKNIQNFNPDAILSFLCNETLFIKNKSKIIYSLRNDPKNTEKNKLFKFLRNYLYSKGRKVVFQTSEAMNYFSTKIKKKGIIILNPVESDKLPHWEDCNHENRIITACRLTKQKNLEMLIKAFSKLKKIYKNELKLEIYGEGEEKDNLENLIKKLKLQNYVFTRLL